MLRDPRFCRTGHAQQEQRAVSHERRDGRLDEAAIADVFGRDFGARPCSAAHEVGDDGLRRELPVGGTRPLVLAAKRLEFVCEDVLCSPAQRRDGGVGFGICLYHSCYPCGVGAVVSASTRSAKSRALRAVAGGSGAIVSTNAATSSGGRSATVQTSVPSSVMAAGAVASRKRCNASARAEELMRALPK